MTLAPWAIACSTTLSMRSTLCWSMMGPISLGRISGWADLDRLQPGAKVAAHLLGDRLVDQQSAASHAELAGEDDERGDHDGHRRIEVGVFEQHDRRLAAEFQSHPLEVLRGTRADRLAGLGAPGEADDRYVGGADEQVAWDVASGDDVDHARWQAVRAA